MNALFVASFAALAAVACAAPSGIHGAGAVLTGPSGIVTSHGAIGPAGHGGWGLGGWGGHGAAVVAAPAIGLGLGHGLGLGGVAVGHGLGLGLGGIGLGGVGLGHGIAVGHAGLGAVTNGGGVISATGHGASVVGPPTAPVVVAGPAGKIVADGLWGPTANIGLGAHGGAWGHGW